MDTEREHEEHKGCCVSHSSDAAVQSLTTSECGSETFLLPFDNQNIFVAPLHVHQGGSEPLYITKLIHTLQYTVETCPYDKARRTRRQKDEFKSAR